VTVLLHAADIDARRQAVAGPLRSLADSLARDLGSVISRDLFIPAEKARMTRRGGRCETDGTMLEFDPVSPRAHRCPRCGAVFDDESHYRWWIMGYQLWLAERAVHAAALFALRRDACHRDFARAVLEGYVDHYLAYPNQDNVLGPTRPFFSTYLESIWLLQLIVALDLLELSAPSDSLGARVRERVIEPSAALIASYDEGLSNRQVWNNAALLAASRMLSGRVDDTALAGSSGLVTHLTSGLLPDGTWYEGENYHLFAHRGLWYGVTIAQVAGVTLDRSLIARFDEAFATPFVTALPDFTFPSRRDSQYRVSLRQWRFAELAELGLVRQPSDDRLGGALATLYDGTVARQDTGRSRSTAEAERNTPATALDRSDLGWRSLLLAMPELPPLAPWSPRSALLAGQGFAVLRRDDGALYAALDYGHSGAGHGHPDRLNVILVHGSDRWLDDVGTGSYVDPSLHWYRSTLAHNAPLVNGRSQERVHGSLMAYEDRGDAGWVRAAVDGVAPGVRFERAIITMPGYVVDELMWTSDDEVGVDLPFHADGELIGAGPWRSGDPGGSTGTEDGFRFLTDVETATRHGGVRLHARLGESSADARVFVNVPHTWWRATSVGAPGSGPTRFYFVRMLGKRGRVVTVWDVNHVIDTVSATETGVIVLLRDATRHHHRGASATWHVAITTGGATSTIDLGGSAAGPPITSPRARPARPPLVVPRTSGTGARGRPLTFELGETQYRRSEPSWAEAGKPSATVAVAVDGNDLVIATNVTKRDIHFAPESASNALDNEHPDTNSDGVQLHAVIPASRARQNQVDVNWLMVPDATSDRVRVSARATGGDPPVMRASWARTATGYWIRCAIALGDFLPDPHQPFYLGVIVNDMAPGRERRRGQLVLGGTAGDFVYLRGDRLSGEEQLAFVIADG